MIASDQPTIFPENLIVYCSSKEDGSMLDREAGFHAEAALKRRQIFCQRNGIDYQDTVYQAIRYGDNETYDTVRVVGRQQTVRHIADVPADALITTEPGVGLLLPVADCAATVLYDSERRILALLHMGRHSTLSNLVPNVMNELHRLGSYPENILAWMGPHAARASYRLAWFDSADEPAWQPYVDREPDGYCVDLAGFNKARLEAAGVLNRNIVVSDVDTMQDANYFSHAGGDISGRMAVLAYMR